MLSYMVRIYLFNQYTLTGMYVGMFLHVALLVEPFSTVLARIGAGVGVDEEVGGEGGGALEHFPTLLALVLSGGTNILFINKTNMICVI